MNVTDTTGTFAALGLREELLAAVIDLGYEAPTPIQERTIPVLLAGRDVIGQAQTGTGKTAAFALPILQKIDLSERKPSALVLTPTRELAIQVAEAIHSYGRRLGEIVVLPIYGGAPIDAQLRKLQRGVHVVVGTPGRVIDHLDRRSLDLSGIRVLVLDEGDEMLRMGFIDDVEKIMSLTPPGRQVALFSATMPREMASIADRYMTNPERLHVEHHALTAPAIEQRFLNVSENQKLTVLMKILEIEPSDAVLVFRRTKTGAAELAEKLEGRGFTAVALHGDMNQATRESVVRRLRSGAIDIVVATDVAARGLDIEQISHVINYDVPNDVEAYVHRIGRTGRAGRNGIATLFITPRERRMLREIERFTGSTIKPGKVPTSADVAAHRVTQFKETVRKTIQEGDLDLYLELVEQLVDEGPFDVAEVAAAAARIATQDRPVAPLKEEPAVSEPRAERAGESFRRPAPQRTFDRPPAREPRGERPSQDGKPRIRLAIGVGLRDGIRPADIVGSIANEADVPGNEIGPIHIGESITVVGVPAESAERIISKVAGARFRGRRLDVRVADASEIDSVAERRPPGRSAAPRSFAPRREQFERGRNENRYEGGEEKKRPGPRPSRPREDSSRSFRPDSRGARPESGPKKFSGSPRPFADHKPGPKRPYSDAKPGPKRPYSAAKAGPKRFAGRGPANDTAERRPSRSDRERTPHRKGPPPRGPKR